MLGFIGCVYVAFSSGGHTSLMFVELVAIMWCTTTMIVEGIDAAGAYFVEQRKKRG